MLAFELGLVKLAESPDKRRMLELIHKYLRVAKERQLEPDTPISSLGAADWRVGDLGLAAGTELGREIGADEALAMKTVGDWLKLAK